MTNNIFQDAMRLKRRADWCMRLALCGLGSMVYNLASNCLLGALTASFAMLLAANALLMAGKEFDRGQRR